MIDSELEKLLEEFDSASRRLTVRAALIDEALEELPHVSSVVLEGHLGWGRTLPVNEAVRAALATAGQEEKETLAKAVEDARQAVVNRRNSLVAL